MTAPRVSSSPTSPETGRAQLERALSLGIEGFRWQLRYLLMVCQVANARPVQPEAPAVLNINITRLETLVRLNGLLSPAARDKLLRTIQALESADLRFPLLARLLASLPEDVAHKQALDLWEQIDLVEDPLARALTGLAIAPYIQEAGTISVLPSALGRLVRIAQAMKNPEARLRGMISIAPHMPPKQGTDVIKAVLNELGRTRNDTLTTRSLITLAPTMPIELTEGAIALARTIKMPVERARTLTALTPFVIESLREQVREDALRAIENIENEDERAEALIALSPYLDSATTAYPRVLEHALAIAVAMNRRPLRARMLVSLAPHLTADLQGEAIAAVHSLTSERERAMLLAQLAPTLPDHMIVASLAVAYTMREQDSRVQALTALAAYAPEHARHQTLLDALASATNLPNHFERVRVLVNLLELLPPPLFDQALSTAIESTRLIENESARARAINLMGGYLNDGLLVRVLEMARELANADHRLSALLGLIPYLPRAIHGEVVQDMLACVVATTLDYKRARAMASIAEHVTADDLRQVDDLATTLTDPIDRLSVFVPLIQHLPVRQRPPYIQKSWQLLRDAEAGYDKASAMVALAPFATGEEREQLIRMIVPTVEGIEDDYDKASAMVILAPLLMGQETLDRHQTDRADVLAAVMESAVALPYPAQRIALLERACELWALGSAPERAFQLWARLADKMTGLPTAHAVQCLGALLPLIRDFGGDEAVLEVAELLGMR